MKIFYLSLILGIILFVSCSIRTEPAKGEFKVIEIPSPSLKNSLIEPKETQKIGIYLPPSYHSSNKSYPVVYFLTGFTVHPGEYPPTSWIDSVMTNNVVQEMIYVEISGHNMFEGTMYANSTVTGNWEDFVTKDVIHYIDHQYRTLPVRESRGIAGHSMGGSGTFNISLKHDDKYAVAYPMSPAISAGDIVVQDIFSDDSLMIKFEALEDKMTNVSEKDFEKKLKTVLDTDDTHLLWSLGYGFAFATDLSQPLRIKLPFERDREGIFVKNEGVWNQWASGFGKLDKQVEQYKNNLLKYRHYGIDCGYNDDFYWIYENTVYYSQLLTKYQIPHSFHLYDGEHSNKVGEQMTNRVMPIMSAYLLKE